MSLVRPNILNADGYVPGEQPADATTIKLNTNENPYPPSPRVMEAIHAVTPDQLRRYPSPNARVFRQAAAAVHGVSPDQIMAFNGGDELLACAIRACAGESDAVAYLDPSYSLYPVLTAVQGARKLEIPYQSDGVNWSLPTGIENTHAAILLIVNPNAPTGHLNPIAALEKIARGFKGLLLIDEAYADFAGESALPLVRDLKLPNIVLLRTMSKGYSLAGLRFGYAIAQQPLLQQLEKVRDSYPVDAIAIAAAAAAIQDQPYARDTWQNVIAERTRLTTTLHQLGLSMPESRSNFLLVTIPAGRGGATGAAKNLYESLKSRGILVRYWDLPRIADKLRITIGTPEQNDRLLAEFRSLI
jgi:histidinol-phosphate aminotransferase